MLVQKSVKASRRGFALVIALSLMAFVLLLVLSISTLVRVESAVSDQQKRRLLARQNALLGLQVALGHVQKDAPDQRVSSTANLAGADPTKANHTVIWDAAADAGRGEVLDLLASRVDATTFDPSLPTDPDWPVLVDECNSEAGVIEAVRAEPIPILGEAGAETGQVSWWVGDEGVKAKVNLAESETAIASTDPVERLRVAARSGIESVLGFDVATFDYASPDFREGLRKTGERGQAGLLNAALADPARERFHDLTFASRSLLTNTRSGGLKEDLTFYAEGGTGAPTGAMIPASYSDTRAVSYDRITWEQLYSHYQLANEINGAGTDKTITARAQTADDAGLAPVLVMLHLNFGFTLESNYDGSDPSQLPADRTYNLRQHIRPWFVVSNPYNIKLTANNYRIRLTNFTNANAEVGYENGGSFSRISSIYLQHLFRSTVLTVPTLELEPGEAKVFTLSYSNNSDYGYTFQIEGNNFFAENNTYYTSGASQQFVFEEGWDAGAATIRFSNSGWTVSGTDLEDGTQLKRMYWRWGSDTDRTGNLHVRTYLGDAPALGTPERIVQNVGQIGFAAPVYDDDFGMAHGGWSLDNLPDSVNTFPTSTTWRNSDYDPSYTDLRNTSGSIGLILHGAATDLSPFYTGFGGWATEYAIRSPRFVSEVPNSAIFPAAYQFKIWPDGSAWFEYLTDENLATEPRFPWGAGYSQRFRPDPAVKTDRAILYDVPRLQSRQNQSAVLSLGQLQHFNAGGWTDTVYNALPESNPILGGELGFMPGAAIANSYASPYVPREGLLSTANAYGYRFLDLSYALNQILFDQYVFSSIPSSGAIDFADLANPRIRPFGTIDDEAYRTTGRSAAEHLYVDGGFNVNSTSVEAWYALLTSLRGLDLGSQTDGEGIFPRSLYQLDAFVEGDVNGVADAESTWAGWRHILDDLDADREERKLYQLAEAIVEEVEARGPFLSLSDFVNRRLVTNTADAATRRQGLSGPLQAALDRTVNADFDSAYAVDPSSLKHAAIDSGHLGSGPIYALDGSTEIAPASAAAGIPAWVMQADVLQPLAPLLTARSDTFIIRANGVAVDPLTGAADASASVEAIVQRMTEFVDGSQPADTLIAGLNDDNARFGRRFKIVSYRFLKPNEL